MQPPPQLLTFTLQASADGRGGGKPSCQLGGGDWAGAGGAPPSGSSLRSSGAGRKVMEGALGQGRPQENGWVALGSPPFAGSVPKVVVGGLCEAPAPTRSRAGRGGRRENPAHL